LGNELSSHAVAKNCISDCTTLKPFELVLESLYFNPVQNFVQMIKHNICFIMFHYDNKVYTFFIDTRYSLRVTSHDLNEWRLHKLFRYNRLIRIGQVKLKEQSRHPQNKTYITVGLTACVSLIIMFSLDVLLLTS